MTVALAVVLLVQPSWAGDVQTVAPTQLHFDARQAPKACNDKDVFLTILGNWIKNDAISEDAARRLSVRIRRSPTGKKIVDVTLIDATGATLGEHHDERGATVECHQVLYDTALASAKLLGASDKPPRPEPCPICPPPPPIAPAPCALCATCPKCPAFTQAVPRVVAPPPAVHRVDVGAGFFLGLGARPVEGTGVVASLGVAPSRHVPHLRFEINGAWARYTSPTSNAAHRDMIPLFGSLCYAPSALRLCSGLVTKLLLDKRGPVASDSDAIAITLAASLDVGMELPLIEPFSIRIDAFALVPFSERIFGMKPAIDEGANLFTAGTSAIAVWSFE